VYMKVVFVVWDESDFFAFAKIEEGCDFFWDADGNAVPYLSNGGLLGKSKETLFF